MKKSLLLPVLAALTPGSPLSAAGELIDSPGPGYRQQSTRALSGGTPVRVRVGDLRVGKPELWIVDPNRMDELHAAIKAALARRKILQHSELIENPSMPAAGASPKR